jgi:putative redox protein
MRETMQAEVKWVEDFKFLGQSQSGHSVVMDGNGTKPNGDCQLSVI